MSQNIIIIGFSRPKRMLLPVLSWIIRLVEGTPYSHCYIKWWSTSFDRWIVYQASGLAVNFVGNTRFAEHSLIIKEFQLPVSEKEFENLLGWAIDMSGTSYGFLHLVGIGVVKFASLFGKKIANPFSGEQQVCAKLIGLALRDVLKQGIDIDLASAGVKDVYSIVESLPQSIPI